MVSLAFVETPAEVYPREGGQIAETIDEKLGLGEVLYLAHSMYERHCGVGSTPAKHSASSTSFDSTSIAAYSHRHWPLTRIAVSWTAISDGCAVGGSGWQSASRCVLAQTAPCERSTPGHPKAVVVSLTDNPSECKRTPNTVTGVGVRSFSQGSSPSMSRISWSMLASCMDTSRFHLLGPHFLI